MATNKLVIEYPRGTDLYVTFTNDYGKKIDSVGMAPPLLLRLGPNLEFVSMTSGNLRTLIGDFSDTNTDTHTPTVTTGPGCRYPRLVAAIAHHQPGTTWEWDKSHRSTTVSLFFSTSVVTNAILRPASWDNYWWNCCQWRPFEQCCWGVINFLLVALSSWIVFTQDLAN